MSKTTPRTDPHRPSVMDPSEYVFVGAADDHPGDSYLEVRHDVLARYGVETGSSDRYSAVNVPFYDAAEDGRPNYRCHHCGKHGSNIRYFVFFLHIPTKQVIVVGQICAKKLNLGTREELDLQKRANEFRRMKARHQWVNDHQEEYNYLKAYNEQAKGGWYSEFFESLWDRVQRLGDLTEGQVNGLHRWMAKGKPWERSAPAPASAIDPDAADRHKAEVTHTHDETTEAQSNLITKLAGELGIEVVVPPTRLAASDLINELKAKRLAQQAPAWVSEPMSDRQRAFINKLMDERVIPLPQRREAREQLDAGLTKGQAKRWIDKLLTLPEVE